MKITGVGLDYLGAKSWSGKITPGQKNEAPKQIQKNLPTALLPIQRGEKPLTGIAADEHRRGRGLEWPPESQIPPFGQPANGSGRIPLCALFEMLCKGEREWGKLSDDLVSWKPDGLTPVSVSAAKLIAQQVDDIARTESHLGLAVPDALGIGGQQLLLSSIRASNIVLVPRSIAAVIGHCRSIDDMMPKGHITVVDTSFGAWSVAKVPLDFRKGPDKTEWNVPVSDARLRKTKLATTGWSLLRKATRAPLVQTLSAGWAQDILTGKISLRTENTEGVFRLDEPYNWHAPLVDQSSLSKGINIIKSAALQIECDSPYKRNLGLMVIGPLASVRFDGKRLADHISNQLLAGLIEIEESTIAIGASWAAAGTANDWPTWLEQMESLELHYVGNDELGNQANLWKEVLPEILVDAGKEYRNPKPITGIRMAAGADKIRIYLRRPHTVENDAWFYRYVWTKPGEVNSDDVPLQINVRARPGQGFASVTVSSIQPNLFESVLDWENMLEAKEPDKPAQGYIEKAITLKAASELWYNCREDMINLRKVLDEDQSEEIIVEACRLATKRLNKAISAANYQKGYGTIVEADEFVLYTPMGRDTTPVGSNAEGAELLVNRVKVAMRKWVKSNPYSRQGISWVKKTAGWLYLGCPDEFVQDAYEDFTSDIKAVEETSLHIAGLCMESENQFLDFFNAFNLKMPQSTAPNNWMKALRNLIKFNEDSLKKVDDEVVEHMFGQTTEKLEWAYHNHRPIITFNALESLFFLLKYRRYNRSFIKEGTFFHQHAQQLAKRIERETNRPKTEVLAKKFITFLNWDGDNEGLGDMLQGDDD